MAVDLEKQTQVMLERLAEYKHLLPKRDEEYQKRKIQFSIPRTETALQRIQHGVYGLCVECGERIGDTRLEAIPAALLCIDCQRQFEKERHG